MAIKLNRYEVDIEKVTHYNQDLSFKTLSELIRHSAESYRDRPFLGIKENGEYHWMSYGEFDVNMRRMRAFLKKQGITRGDRVALITSNSQGFAEIAYAAYGLGAIIVPMYEVQAEEDWRYILEDCTPALIVVRTPKIYNVISRFSFIDANNIYILDPAGGPGLLETAHREEPLDASLDDAREDDICDIIYTSGTTGKPRGVELTHHNVVHDVLISACMFDYGCEDRVLSFLPWAHGFGKTVDFSLFPALGAAVGLAESPKTIAQNLQEVHPTVLCAVPKIFTRIYDQIHMKMESSRAIRILFQRAQRVMHKARTGKLNRLEEIEYRLADRFVASQIRHIFGGSLKFCVSGGASLSREIAIFFEDFGIRVFEGYGMTEHSPVISINYNPDKLGSVGVPLPSVKIEIEPIHDGSNEHENAGEIVVSSECVMKGYHNNPQATADIIDENGRLHTGDTGYIDEDGFIYILGRVKEQYKLSNGKYVVPSALEEVLNRAPEIAYSVVFGAGKPYNIVLLRPSDALLQKYLPDHSADSPYPEDLANQSRIRSAVGQALQKACESLRGYEKPQKFAIILEDFTIENGLLTPALKIKRHAVEQHFHDIIESLYQD